MFNSQIMCSNIFKAKMFKRLLDLFLVFISSSGFAIMTMLRNQE